MSNQTCVSDDVNKETVHVAAHASYDYISRLSISHDESALTLQGRMLEDTSGKSGRVRDYLLELPITEFMYEVMQVFSLKGWSTDQFYEADLGALLRSHPRKVRSREWALSSALRKCLRRKV